MEGRMLSPRIFASSVVLVAVTMGSAVAQDATSVGKPLSLLQFAQHRAKTPPYARAKAVEKLAKKAPKLRIAKHVPAKPRHLLAAVQRHPAVQPALEPVQTSRAAPQPSIWPAVNAAAPAAIAMPAPPAAPQNVTTEQVLSDAPNDIAANGRIAQAVPAADPNVPDPAPGHHDAAAAEMAEPAQAAAPEPAVRAMVVTPEPAESNEQSAVGSASWMAQVLAALGGAVTAGAVAWFLILRRRPEPEDTEYSYDALVPGE
jgi:hypothetical protein